MVVGDQLKLQLWQLDFHLCIIYDILFHFVVPWHFIIVGVTILEELFVSVCLCVYLHYAIVKLLWVASTDGL